MSIHIGCDADPHMQAARDQIAALRSEVRWLQANAADAVSRERLSALERIAGAALDHYRDTHRTGTNGVTWAGCHCGVCQAVARLDGAALPL